MSMITRATVEDVKELAILFDLYRSFYQQPSDIARAEQFLHQRLTLNESVIFIAKNNGQYLGFTQLYPTFSSISMKRVWILNDLFVAAEARNQGVGEQLLQAAKTFARESGAKSLTLSTAHDNDGAQRLYERFGFERDQQFYPYELLV